VNALVRTRQDLEAIPPLDCYERFIPIRVSMSKLLPVVSLALLLSGAAHAAQEGREDGRHMVAAFFNGPNWAVLRVQKLLKRWDPSHKHWGEERGLAEAFLVDPSYYKPIWTRLRSDSRRYGYYRFVVWGTSTGTSARPAGGTSLTAKTGSPLDRGS
jgi:hypothetical protein